MSKRHLLDEHRRLRRHLPLKRNGLSSHGTKRNEMLNDRHSKRRHLTNTKTHATRQDEAFVICISIRRVCRGIQLLFNRSKNKEKDRYENEPKMIGCHGCHGFIGVRPFVKRHPRRPHLLQTHIRVHRHREYGRYIQRACEHL